MPGRPKNQKQRSPNWGGKRENQTGRPTLKEEKASVLISYRITPSEARILEEVALPEEKLSQTARRLMLDTIAKAQLERD